MRDFSAILVTWGLRDYGVSGQIGLEPTPEAFIEKMVAVFAEVKRVLREDGTLWLNIGDSYNGIGGPGKQDGGPIGPTAAVAIESTKGRRVVGLKPKDLCMMPWRVALALQADGWYLRSVIVWAKKSPMPESVRDRPTSSWEPIFLMSKSERYFYDAEAVKEAWTSGRDDMREKGVRTGLAYLGGAFNNSVKDGNPGDGMRSDGQSSSGGRNLRNVWHLGPEPYSQAHFATFPTEIPRRAILAGTSEKGCCPECGAGWERVTERTNMVIAPSGRDGRIAGNGMRSTSGAMVEPPTSKTLGWKRGCECNAGEPIPCTVLDPFLGSGTTIAVARQLGRHGIGCELNPEYVKLAEDRIGKAEKPHTYASKREDDSPLFTEAA